MVRRVGSVSWTMVLVALVAGVVLLNSANASLPDVGEKSNKTTSNVFNQLQKKGPGGGGSGATATGEEESSRTGQSGSTGSSGESTAGQSSTSQQSQQSTSGGQSGLQLQLGQHNIPSQVTGQDILDARIALDTNADTLFLRVGSTDHQIFDDGSHVDKMSGDGTYGTSIDISGLSGEKTVSVVAKNGGKSMTKTVKTVAFRRQLPAPSIDYQQKGSSLMVDVATDYQLQDGGSDVTFKTSLKVKRPEAGVKQASADSLPKSVVAQEEWTSSPVACSAGKECSASKIFSPGIKNDDTVIITATAKRKGVNSPEARKEISISDVPTITDVAYQSYTGNKMATNADSWRAQRIAFTKSGFSASDIQSVYLTAGGQKIADTTDTAPHPDAFFNGNTDGAECKKSSSSEDISGCLSGDILAGWAATVPAKHISTDGTDIKLTVALTGGRTVTAPIGTVTAVDDTTPPELVRSDIKHETGDIILEVTFEDNLQAPTDVTCTETFTGADFNCGGGGAIYGLSSTQSKDITSVIQGTGVAEPAFQLSDGRGNTATVAGTPQILDPDSVLQPVEVNGDSTNKINLVVHAHNIPLQRAKELLATSMNNFFTEGDLSFIGQYRDMFNWFIIDTETKLCTSGGYESGGLSGTGKAPKCSFTSTVFEQSDALKGAKAGIIIMSGDEFRSFVVWKKARISYHEASPIVGSKKFIARWGMKQLEKAVPGIRSKWKKFKSNPPIPGTGSLPLADVDATGSAFSHELGHLIWQFNDEYTHNPGEDAPMETSYFFHEGMEDKPQFEVPRYPNTWRHKQRKNGGCAANVTAYYQDTLSPSDCLKQRGGFLIQRPLKGPSLMKLSSSYVLYPPHRKRISYLMEKNPVYE